MRCACCVARGRCTRRAVTKNGSCAAYRLLAAVLVRGGSALVGALACNTQGCNNSAQADFNFTYAGVAVVLTVGAWRHISVLLHRLHIVGSAQQTSPCSRRCYRRLGRRPPGEKSLWLTRYRHSDMQLVTHRSRVAKQCFQRPTRLQWGTSWCGLTGAVS